ncbi:capsule assembly Wzi family protein [Aliikangiella coralliicola]|uniref:capsule assembly Wzi family protein n=1 Tax=Aliikangiella coralliicola TaxID=2592383 RepID=UPI00143D6870|nr:capsule assembly Wzi family protein [Aliikangiella coralliicola]
MRADIELLADQGIITVPITTYPLMWSGIIKDLDDVDIADISTNYKDVYWRVKKSGKEALYKNLRQVRVSLSNQEQTIRSFGDEGRAKAEINARRSGMNKRFAWNIEITRVRSPQDKKTVRFDGSYGSVVSGNWIVTLGAVEKWWGPTWNSAILLSNNARPPVGISVQRNYSDNSSNPIFGWLGAWTFNGFIGQLDDQRVIKDTKLTGLSFSFKPHHSVEIGLRATGLWGGEGRTESFTSLIDNFIGNDKCELISERHCLDLYGDDYYSQNGHRLAGLDFRWKLPFDYPVSFYASLYGENESELIPSKTIQQFGLTSSFQIFGSHWKWFAESSDTSSGKGFSQTYESPVYQTGYRYYSRNIGSTYDNDADGVSLGVLGALNRQNRFKFSISSIKMNQDNSNRSDVVLPTIGKQTVDIKRITIDWSFQYSKLGNVNFGISYSDNIYDEFIKIEDKTRFSLDWEYRLQ